MSPFLFFYGHQYIADIMRLPYLIILLSLLQQKTPDLHKFIYKSRVKIHFHGATLFQAFESSSARYLHISDFLRKSYVSAFNAALDSPYYSENSAELTP